MPGKLHTVFPAQIEIDTDHIEADGESIPLTQGKTITAEIKVGTVPRYYNVIRDVHVR